ncbi:MULTISPECIES: hypothetical protein [Legionella]|uniref:Fe-S protein n=2 Tax=Legionella TaxID=445 RepID=A0A0W0SAT3_9GAMM|nr:MULTISPECIES: hypothetical protein [Legionella]KTC80141.1 hypothetical protein Lche_2161 [Legionella cherrii]MCL9682848.1 hypothetical protein [Legionella maioricensis]MCL9686524.1 hypothetical protein [Legionella maioricensis]
MRLFVFTIGLFISLFTYGASTHPVQKETKSDNEPPKIGNFALPLSQQPGPLVSFGQNIIEKNETLLFLFADDFAGVEKHFVDVMPSILYGITDDLSIFINAPMAVSYVQNEKKSSGFEDAFLQLEDAFYTKKTSSFVEQATLVMNLTLPTGSAQKQPPTGFGSPSFFIGGTLSRMYVDWFAFASPGVVVTTKRNDTKFGNQFLYQGGFGRHLINIKGWMFAWMVEADGQYSQRNKIDGAIDFNSGGNVVYITPSLWVSSKKLILQLGIGLPVTQNLYGNQTRDSYLLVANLGWTL